MTEIPLAEEEKGEPKKLYRSRDDKVIGGVCGGIAEYTGIDATIIRLLWVLLTLGYGTGLIIYIILMIVIPIEPE
ncbi:MAG: PspC domain-containing protein [Candidatus Thorarchaeota archaeon]|nr:PspC domain-containing protein [Candidatus Thorarchaeota archaeon]